MNSQFLCINLFQLVRTAKKRVCATSWWNNSPGFAASSHLAIYTLLDIVCNFASCLSRSPFVFPPKDANGSENILYHNKRVYLVNMAFKSCIYLLQIHIKRKNKRNKKNKSQNKQVDRHFYQFLLFMSYLLSRFGF